MLSSPMPLASPSRPVRARRELRGNIQLPVLFIIALVLGLVFVYAAKSSPATPSTSEPPIAPSASATPAGSKPVGSVTSLIGGLEERLQRDPDDGEGWLLLARSYDHVGKLDEARAAYERAAALGIDDAAFASALTARAQQHPPASDAVKPTDGSEAVMQENSGTE